MCLFRHRHYYLLSFNSFHITIHSIHFIHSSHLRKRFICAYVVILQSERSQPARATRGVEFLSEDGSDDEPFILSCNHSFGVSTGTRTRKFLEPNHFYPKKALWEMVREVGERALLPISLHSFIHSYGSSAAEVKDEVWRSK